MAKINQHMPWYDEDEPHEGIPVRMVANWTDTVLRTEGQKPQRGFGGRILFYEEGSEEPILVEGALVVYAFDEANRSPTDTKPTLIYDFAPEDLPKRMSKCDLGVSYNFWLPWDEDGGPQKDISLICRFEPKTGPIVMGEQTRHRLPGKVQPVAAQSQSPLTQLPDGVPFRAAPQMKDFKLPGPSAPVQIAAAPSQLQQASYEQLAPTGNGMTPVQGGGTLQSVSIALPDSMRGGGQGLPAHREAAPAQVAAPQQQIAHPVQTGPNSAGPVTTMPNTQIQNGIMNPLTRQSGYRLASPQMNSGYASTPTGPQGFSTANAGAMVPHGATQTTPQMVGAQSGSLAEQMRQHQQLNPIQNQQVAQYQSALQPLSVPQTSPATPMGQLQTPIQGYSNHQGGGYTTTTTVR